MYCKTDDQTRIDPFQDVTERILAALKQAQAVDAPMDPDRAVGPQSPFNPNTGKHPKHRQHYRRINVLILATDPRSFASEDLRWMTYQQAREAG